MVDFKKLSMLSNISRDIVNKEHPSFDENRKRVFCLGFLGGFNYSEKNSDANSETIDAVSRDSMNRSNPWYEEYEKETYLLGFNRGYSYVANDEARHYRQYMENPFSDQIGLGEATLDYDSADAAGLGVQFPILLKGTIIGWLPVDAIYDKDKPNHLISDDSHYLRMSSVGDSAEIKKEYRGQGYGKAAYYELAVKAARMGMVLCSAPDSSRSENANNLWKSLVSSGYARQNGDRYEFINSKLIVTNKAVGGGIQTASKDMTKLEEIALNAAKPHDYDPAEKQVFQNGYVKGANTMLEAVEEILDRNKQAYMYSKEYYVNIDVFKQRIDELKERKPAVSKEAPEKAFKDGYVKGVNAILDYFKEPLGRSEHTYRYNGVPYIKVDVFTQMIDELKDKMPAISEETPEKALKPDINQEQEFIDEIDDDSLLVPPNASLKIDQLRALAVKLFGENVAFSLCSYPEVDRVCIGYEPVDITIDRIEIKDGQLKLMSENFGGEIDQRYLFWDQVEAISTMLKEVHTAYEKTNKAGETEDERLADAKAKLFTTILEAQKDLGDVFSIAPTEISENGDKHVLTEILPDFESPFEDQNIIGGVSHLKDEDCVHNLALCLENVNDAEALDKAVHEAHVKHLEQGAKQSIHDRIVTPSARRFTPDQVDILNRYHQVVVPDKPAGEVFKELLQEVAQDPDVARKPEKWVTDTAKELDGLAEGITRDQVRGLHK